MIEIQNICINFLLQFETLLQLLLLPLKKSHHQTMQTVSDVLILAVLLYYYIRVTEVRSTATIQPLYLASNSILCVYYKSMTYVFDHFAFNKSLPPPEYYFSPHVYSLKAKGTWWGEGSAPFGVMTDLRVNPVSTYQLRIWSNYLDLLSPILN